MPCLALPCPPCLQASRVLDCLLQEASSTDGEVATVWHLLRLLSAQQLKALSACPKFFDLHHLDVPAEPLPEAAVEAVLEVGGATQLVGAGCCRTLGAGSVAVVCLFEESIACLQSSIC